MIKRFCYALVFAPPAAAVELAFLEANPDFSAYCVTVTCKQGRMQEGRICLNKGLGPRACGGG